MSHAPAVCGRQRVCGKQPQMRERGTEREGFLTLELPYVDVGILGPRILHAVPARVLTVATGSASPRTRRAEEERVMPGKYRRAVFAPSVRARAPLYKYLCAPCTSPYLRTSTWVL